MPKVGFARNAVEVGQSGARRGSPDSATRSARFDALGAGLLARPHYRQYRIGRVDVALFGLRGVLLVGAISALYSAYGAADGVTIPNVLLATRGLFVLGAGYLLGKLLKTPMESQPGRVYALRVLGALLILGSIVLVFAG